MEIWAPTFFKHNNSSVATVCGQTKLHPCNRGAVVRQCLWGNQDPLPKHFKLTLTSTLKVKHTLAVKMLGPDGLLLR